jgi:hypothetical protein
MPPELPKSRNMNLHITRVVALCGLASAVGCALAESGESPEPVDLSQEAQHAVTEADAVRAADPKCACKYSANDPAATIITDDCPTAQVCANATCVVDVNRDGTVTRETLTCEDLSPPPPPPPNAAACAETLQTRCDGNTCKCNTECFSYSNTECVGRGDYSHVSPSQCDSKVYAEGCDEITCQLWCFVDSTCYRQRCLAGAVCTEGGYCSL